MGVPSPRDSLSKHTQCVEQNFLYPSPGPGAPEAAQGALQVVLGPRPVGKSTLALQVAQSFADEPTLKEAPWLETQ